MKALLTWIGVFRLAVIESFEKDYVAGEEVIQLSLFRITIERQEERDLVGSCLEAIGGITFNNLTSNDVYDLKLSHILNINVFVIDKDTETYIVWITQTKEAKHGALLIRFVGNEGQICAALEGHDLQFYYSVENNKGYLVNSKMS